MDKKICPLVKGECIGISCMGCKERTREYRNGVIVNIEKYYTCELFNIEVSVRRTKNETELRR